MNDFWINIFLKILLIVAILLCIGAAGFFVLLALYAFGVVM